MKNILIIKPSSFGDIVQALPVAARARETWPEARISWLLNTQYRRLLEPNPCVDRLYLFDRDRWRKRRDLAGAASSLLALCRELRAASFDAVLDLQGLFRSGVLTLAAGAPVRAGFADAREFAHLFYTVKVRAARPDLHAVDRCLLAAAAIGCRGSRVSFPLGLGPGEESWAERVTAGRRPLVGLSPSGRWRTKRWPDDSFARLGELLLGRGAAVAVIGGPAGEAAGVAARLRGRAIVADDVADPLRLAALLGRLDLLVTNDTGPMHLAAAAGTRVVALFGPTNPDRTGPWGEGHRVLRAPVDCAPCYERECPRGDDCMRAITVEAVLYAVEECLAAGSRS
ncbi:MAG: glycosyltransferase family 9 protein [bacterium]|nr:glycosyltransferase family 9 protein [bacterium]